MRTVKATISTPAMSVMMLMNLMVHRLVRPATATAALGAGASVHPADPTTLLLAGHQTMRFVRPGEDKRTGVVGIDLWATPGAPKQFESIDFCGVTWRLVTHPEAV